MERLTWRDQAGMSYGVPPFKFYRVLERLCDFEEIVAPDGAEEYDLSRLKELVEADREGRCVVRLYPVRLESQGEGPEEPAAHCPGPGPM